MKVTFAAVLAAATSVAAWGNVTYTTEIVTALTTYCPAPTEITHAGHTYTVTEATTLTITNCPCTVTKPVTTVSSVICHSCNSTAPPTESVVPTTAAPTTTAPPTVTAGAGKAAALSGGALAGVLGLAAFVL